MTVCKDITIFSRTYETIADLCLLLAGVLLCMSIGVALEYYQPTMHWLSGNYVTRMPLLGIGLASNAFAILALLVVGAARFGEEDERCFSVFRSRRSQHGTKGMLAS